MLRTFSDCKDFIDLCFMYAILSTVHLIIQFQVLSKLLENEDNKEMVNILQYFNRHDECKSKITNLVSHLLSYSTLNW